MFTLSFLHLVRSEDGDCKPSLSSGNTTSGICQLTSCFSDRQRSCYIPSASCILSLLASDICAFSNLISNLSHLFPQLFWENELFTNSITAWMHITIWSYYGKHRKRLSFVTDWLKTMHMGQDPFQLWNDDINFGIYAFKPYFLLSSWKEWGSFVIQY